MLKINWKKWVVEILKWSIDFLHVSRLTRFLCSHLSWVEFVCGITQEFEIIEKLIGRLKTVKTDNNIERVKALTKKNKRLTVAEIVLEIDISFGSTYSIIHNEQKQLERCRNYDL